VPKDPAVLFYTSDFISGTLTMSDEDVGKYIRLLCLQHQKGHLTEKDMLYICSTYVEDVYEKFEIDADGLYYNKRMENETKKRKKYSESRRKNILNRYKQKGISAPTYVATHVLHMENENEDKKEGIVKGRKQTARPTIEDVKNYAGGVGLIIDAGAFIDHYESNGWKVGRAQMKDWRAAVRNWCRRNTKPQLTNAQKQTLASLKQFDERMKSDAGHI